MVASEFGMRLEAADVGDWRECGTEGDWRRVSVPERKSRCSRARVGLGAPSRPSAPDLLSVTRLTLTTSRFRTSQAFTPIDNLAKAASIHFDNSISRLKSEALSTGQPYASLEHRQTSSPHHLLIVSSPSTGMCAAQRAN